MNHVFDVLTSIGAAAYCTQTGLEDMARLHPNRSEACKAYSGAITADLMDALSAQMIDPYTVRDYLRMLCELREYRSMFLYVVLCFTGVEKPVPRQFLEYGQNPETLTLLMRQMLSDMDGYIEELNRLEDDHDE